MPTLEKNTVRMEHLHGSELAELLNAFQKQIQRDEVYTITIRHEQNKTHKKASHFIPEFYDDKADSEAEIQDIISARKNTKNREF